MKILRILTRADRILILVLLAAALLPALFMGKSGQGSQVLVTKEGALYGTWPLDEDARIVIDRDGHRNVLVIEDGTVRMAEASCKNQDCVLQGAVFRSGQTIVCLPARIAVEVRGGGEADDVDAVVH